MLLLPQVPRASHLVPVKCFRNLSWQFYLLPHSAPRISFHLNPILFFFPAENTFFPSSHSSHGVLCNSCTHFPVGCRLGEQASVFHTSLLWLEFFGGLSSYLFQVTFHFLVSLVQIFLLQQSLLKLNLLLFRVVMGKLYLSKPFLFMTFAFFFDHFPDGSDH